VIEQTRFLSTVFLCSEFNFLENIYSGVNFCREVIFICGNLFLRIAGIKSKNAKIRTHKISCHTVGANIQITFTGNRSDSVSQSLIMISVLTDDSVVSQQTFGS